MSFGPVASTLVLLSEIERCAPGQKVRFLGCVDEYATSSGTLKLKHNYPPASPPTIVNVNIDHVLETVKRKEIDIGTWLNVVGYIERPNGQSIAVQAITVWNAGIIDLDAYQRAVVARKEAG